MTPRRPVLAAPIAGFGAYFLAQLLRTHGPRHLEWLRAEVDAGRLHPAYLEQARQAWAAIEAASGEWLTWRSAADGTTAEPISPSAASSEVITTREAAEMLGLKERRVRQLLAEGRLTGQQAGRTWLVDRASVELFRATRSAA